MCQIIRSVRDQSVFVADGAIRLLTFREPGGPLAGGTVPIGLALHWQTGEPPDQWPVVVSDDQSTTGDTWRYDGTAIELPKLVTSRWRRH